MKLREANITNTFFDASLEENVKDRMKKMDIEASLEVSVMAGLVKVSILIKFNLSL